MMNDPLDAPCQWCGYNGPGYWQADTHTPSCRWHAIGGWAEREEELSLEHARREHARRDLQLDIEMIVSQVMGAASLCWDPTPHGVFDAERAVAIARDATERLLALYRRVDDADSPRK